MVDLDPRWVIKLIKRGEMQEMELYKRHVIDQALTLLRAHENIKCLFTTPKLLEALCERASLKKLGITGVFCGGTEMTPQFHRFAVEELVEGAYFAPTYGNTLMGLATHKPRTKPDDPWDIIYFPPSPRAAIEVVDPDQPDRLVAYGATGRVRLTTLTKEFFMPRFLERDEAEREPPCDLYPWDGVQERAAVLALPVRGGGGGVLMLHLPILRQGRPYQSVEVATVPHFRTKQPFAGLSQANAGLVRRDLREDRQAAMRASLAAFRVKDARGHLRARRRRRSCRTPCPWATRRRAPTTTCGSSPPPRASRTCWCGATWRRSAACSRSSRACSRG